MLNHHFAMAFDDRLLFIQNLNLVGKNSDAEQKAAHCLSASLKKAGLHLLFDSKEDYPVLGCWQYPRPDLASPQTILADFLIKHSLDFSPEAIAEHIGKWYYDTVEFRKSLSSRELRALDRDDEARIQKKINIVLDETQIVLHGAEFCHHCFLVEEDGYFWSFTHREWALHLYQWARQNEWMKQFRIDAPEWFYGNEAIIPNYRAYVSSLYGIMGQTIGAMPPVSRPNQ